MIFAIVSDIHGNLDAFRSVLEDMKKHPIERLYSLGDNIGYGAEPHKVIETIQNRNIESVLGNHEFAILNEAYRRRLNPSAHQSIEITRHLLNSEAIEYIQTLPKFRIVSSCRLVHGFPPDSIFTYAFQVSDFSLSARFKQMEEPISFVGHTHLLELIEYDGKQIKRSELSEGKRSLVPSHRYIINIGSVGQPRDESNTAKYVIYDTIRKEINIRFVPYDVDSACRKIIDMGFPKGNANRLR